MCAEPAGGQRMRRRAPARQRRCAQRRSAQRLCGAGGGRRVDGLRARRRACRAARMRQGRWPRDRVVRALQTTGNSAACSRHRCDNETFETTARDRAAIRWDSARPPQTAAEPPHCRSTLVPRTASVLSGVLQHASHPARPRVQPWPCQDHRRARAARPRALGRGRPPARPPESRAPLSASTRSTHRAALSSMLPRGCGRGRVCVCLFVCVCVFVCLSGLRRMDWPFLRRSSSTARPPRAVSSTRRSSRSSSRWGEPI